MYLKKQFILLLIALFFISVVFIPQKKPVRAEQAVWNNGCSTDRGLDVVFVLDDSGSMTTNDSTNIRLSESNKLIGSLKEYDRAAVIKFNEEAENLQSLTSNRYLITTAFNGFASSGGTDMSEGIRMGLDEFEHHGGNNHKIMVVLTDGDSVNNNVSLDLAGKAYEENITIYTIGLGNTTTINVPVLTDIADKTGGEYFHAVNASKLTSVFNDITKAVEDIRGPKVYSDWTLTEDLHMSGDLVLTENMKMDLNGYDLRVDGDLVLLSCSELRSVSGKITAKNFEQEAGSLINLNNSQLEVGEIFTQDGLLRVNGDFGGDSEEEIIVDGDYKQKIRGDLDLNGFQLTVDGNLKQEGHFDAGGGLIYIKNDMTQKGWFDLNHGKLTIDGNLTIGSLMDDEFTKDKSMNLNGGYLRVGSPESMEETTEAENIVQAGSLDSTRETIGKGNVMQKSGQLYVNYGIVDIFGDYTITGGWLTMIHGTEDTTNSGVDISESHVEIDGDYVHVHKNFTMESPRNHKERLYSYLGNPMNDQAQLTDGILQVDGNFTQVGDKEFHPIYSDRSQDYKEDYSRYNFVAEGRHKVLLTGRGEINVQGSGFQFNILELDGKLTDYQMTDPVRWNQLIENDKSANADLKSLAINDIPVENFNSAVLNYNHTIPSSGITGPLRTLKVDARADDFRNAKVEITGNTIREDGTAQVKVLVTAHDGTTTKLYTVNVTVGDAQLGKVTSIELDRSKQLFIKEGSSTFSPEKVTIGYTVYPTNADNQIVHWMSTDPSVAMVSANGIVTPLNVGKTTIVAETEDGHFKDSVTIEVKLPYDLLEGVKTLADFVMDPDRYDQIMSLYTPSKIGIVVPGQYIQSLAFTSSGNLVSGIIKADSNVSRIEVRVNNQQLPALETTSYEYLFSRTGLKNGDYVQVVAYNSAGDELDRIGTVYPLDYQQNTTIPFGFYSIEYLIGHPILFNSILDQYSLEELRFVAK